MNGKVAKNGQVMSVSAEADVRNRLFAGVVPGTIKTAAAECVEEKKEEKDLKSELKDKTKMSKAEAEAMGFFKAAKSMGWGIYDAAALDGGLGSIWHLEKEADGQEYLVKQIDEAGEVMRRAKTS